MRRPWGMTAAVVLLPLVAGASDKGAFIDDSPMTSHKWATSTILPEKRPYFLGWSSVVTPPSGFFESTLEAGGVAIDVPGQSIYAGTRDGWIVCLGPGGEQKWRVDIGGEVLAPPTLYNEYLIVGTSEGVLNILNKVTGERLARGILGEELITQPVVAEFPGGVKRVFVGSGAESLFAVELDTGQKLWRAHRDPPSGFSVYGFAKPVVTPTSVYVGYADGYVEARDPATGSLQWEKHISPNADMQDVDGLATNGRAIFAASYSGGIFALEPGTGNVTWQKPMSRANRVVVDGPMLYAGAPGLWQGMRAADGVASWRFHLDDDESTSEGIVGDRYLAFTVVEGPMYLIDKFTGEPKGLFASGQNFSSPPAVAGPAMAVLSNGGIVYTMTAVP